MFIRLMLVVILILASFLLASHTEAQNPKPAGSPEGTSVRSPEADPSPSVPERLTFTLKYSLVLFQNTKELRPVVTGFFPNHKQARFIIDTGATDLFVSENLAHDLNLFPVTAGRRYDGLTINGKALNRVVLPVFDMEASSLTSPLVSATVINDYRISGYSVVVPQRNAACFGVDGVIGTAIFGQGALLLDGPKQEVTIFMGGNLTEAEREQIGLSGATTSVVLTPPNESDSTGFTVPVTLENNGSSEQMVLRVDTGANFTSLPRKAALALHLQPTTFSSPASGLAGTEKMDIAPVETLKIGDLALHDLPVYYPSEDKEASWALVPKGASFIMLGMNVLAGYRVLLDFPARRMYLSTNQPRLKITVK